MADTRHLTSTDTISVLKTGSQPSLKIGDMEYVFPTDPVEKQQIANQFRSAWTELEQVLGVGVGSEGYGGGSQPR